MKHIICTALSAMIILVFTASCSTKSQGKSYIKDSTTSISAVVESIDLKNRIVTLKEETGDIRTISVSDEVKNLETLDVGDHVITVCQKAVVVRMAKPGDVEISDTVVSTTGEKDMKPAGSRVTVKTLTATIVGKSVSDQTITLMGPEGNKKEVYVKDPEKFNTVKLGDKLHITFTEAYAVSVIVEDE